MFRLHLGRLIAIVLAALLALSGLVWVVNSSNPDIPAGYVGYLTQGSVFGKTKFYGTQLGPSSPGKIWMLSSRNVSITPYTYTEDFKGDESVLSQDNLKLQFSIHLVWKVRADGVQQFVEHYSMVGEDGNPDKLAKVAYDNFLREPLRTYARDEIQRHKGLDVKDQITPIGDAIFERVKNHVVGTPFEVSSVVVGNIQYPSEVADAVAQKMATTQVLERKQTEISIEEAEAKKRIVQAEGIAKATEIIQAKLTDQYLQHEAIEAQKAMAGSQNHTTVYIPVGNMGVPLVGTLQQPHTTQPPRATK